MKLMFDLETLGTKPNSAILSVGIVAFTDKEIVDTFYTNVDLNSSLGYGFDIDADTVYWWLKQSKEAGNILSKDTQPIQKVVSEVSTFISKFEVKEVWGNSPSFDLVMMRNLFDKVGAMWKLPFWIERDYRTFLDLTKITRCHPEIAHNALEDAKAQAQTVINYTKEIKIEE